MIWILVSIPLWCLGGIFLLMGVCGLGRLALNETDLPAFKSCNDGEAAIFSFGLLAASSIALYLAARMVA